MKLRLWPLRFLFLLTLTLFVGSSLARDEATEVVLSELESSASEHGFKAEEFHDGEDIEDVSPAVQEALEILQSLEGRGEGFVRRSRPSGPLEKVIYYAKIVFHFLFMNGPTESKPRATKLDPLLAKALPILVHAAEQNDPGALYLLGEMNLYGNFTHPRDYNVAFDYYEALATLTGNATAQNSIGFMYATGLGGVERDQAKALLYHTFAADQGDTKSEMTVAFRHHSGISTPRSCDKAAYYYKRVADKAMAYWKAGPLGGTSLPKASYRWADEEGGLYGEGASVSSAGLNANRDSGASMDYIMEYLDMEHRDGDLKATFSLGKLHYEGSRTTKRNFRQAQKHFMKVARAYWGKDGNINPNAPKGIDKIAGKAAAHIGRMFLRGEGMEQNYVKAATWFKRGIQNGDPFSQYQMGLLYLEGLGVPKDAVKAASFFKAAADSDLAAAQSALGVLFLDQGDVDTANRYFEVAARHGYMEAFYYLAEIAEKGLGRDRHCGMATAYYKIVAEKAEALHSSFPEANAAYESGDTETALILSMTAAEQGYETAQVNVAYLLDSQKSVVDLRSAINPYSSKQSSPSHLSRIKPLALIYFTRSAKQNNVDSLVKAGDYYLSGTGVLDSVPNLEAASTCYHTAAEGHHSAQAFWNLGWMHENGIAVSQDFHMAKRFYDLALETNSEAYLPVKLALGKLRFRSWWNSVSGGSINSINSSDDDPKPQPGRTLSEWLRNFWENAEEQAATQHAAMMDAEGGDLDLDLGAGHDDPMPTGDVVGDYLDEFDDGIIESLIIIGLAATLAALVFWRQQRQLAGGRRARDGQARNQAHGQAPQQQNGGEQAAGAGAGGDPPQQGERNQAQQEQDDDAAARGLFPDPADPQWGNWVAGGVGH